MITRPGCRLRRQKREKKRDCFQSLCFLLVGMAGFEPVTPSSRTKCSTKLSYIPLISAIYYNKVSRKSKPYFLKLR